MLTNKVLLIIFLFILIFCSLFGGCSSNSSSSNNTQRGDSPNNPVLIGKSLLVNVPWESANAEMTVLKVNKNKNNTSQKNDINIDLKLGASGKIGGIFPYYIFEFELVGQKGMSYKPSYNTFYKVEVLSGHAEEYSLSFSDVDPTDSSLVLMFKIPSSTGNDDKISYFSLK